MKSSPLAI